MKNSEFAAKINSPSEGRTPQKYPRSRFFEDETGSWEPESSLFPMRTYFKRLYTMLQERGVKEPVIMPHDTTTLYAGPMAFCTIPMELEAPQSDLLRGQVFGIGEAYMMCNVMAFQHGLAGSGMVCPNPNDAYRKGDYRIARTFLGGMLLFDSHPIFGVMPQEAYRMEYSLGKFGYDQPGVEYVPYWRAGDLQQVGPAGVKVSLFRNGKKALLVMCNDNPTAVKVRWKPTAKFQHTGESMTIPDLEIINPGKITDPCWRPPRGTDGAWQERQEPPPVKEADGSWVVEIPPYDYRLVHTGTEGGWGPKEEWGPVDPKLFERNLKIR